MTIIKKPTATATAAFISQAPDATSKAKPSTTSDLTQITLKLSVELLARVDEAARKNEISRAAFIKMTLANAVD